MKAINTLIVVLLGALCVAAFSLNAAAAFTDDGIEKHPIDVEFEKKTDADPSTAGMIDACRWAEKEWDKLLNNNYKLLMKKLDKDNQTRLRNSQREWVKFRDLEFAFNGNFYGEFDGTMYRTVAAGVRVDFVRERALRLGCYLDDLNEK